MASQAQSLSVVRATDRNLREIADYLSTVQSTMPASAEAPATALLPITSPKAATGLGKPAKGGALLVIDVSQHQLTSEQFKKIASAALLKRGWQIIATETDRVVGSLENVTKSIVRKSVYGHPTFNSVTSAAMRIQVPTGSKT